MEIPIGEDADELAALQHGKMADAMLSHECVSMRKPLVEPDRVGVDGHVSTYGRNGRAHDLLQRAAGGSLPGGAARFARYLQTADHGVNAGLRSVNQSGTRPVARFLREQAHGLQLTSTKTGGGEP